MPLTDSYHTIAKYLEQLLIDNKAALGLQAVYYGDQERIPHTPTACVEPGGKTLELNGAPRRASVEITNYILIYHSAVKSVQQNREDNDQLAEAIESLVHQDAQMRDVNGEPQVIQSLVTRTESGYQVKANTLFRASRLTIEATSQVQLPSSA